MPALSERKPAPTLPRAMTIADICGIAGEYAVAIARLLQELGAQEPTGEQLAIIGGRLLTENPDLYDALVAAGCGCRRDHAANLPVLQKALLAFQVISLTRTKFANRPLWPIIRDHLTPLLETI